MLLLELSVVIFSLGSVFSLKDTGPFYCHGDICKRDQFCSPVFRYCRNCDEIRDDCGTTNQPFNCTAYCTGYLADLEVRKREGSSCTQPPITANGGIDVTNESQTYTQGEQLEIRCDTGYRLVYMNVARCGPFGDFYYSTPRCEAISCTSPPHVQNALISFELGKSEFKVGDEITLNCIAGFHLYGSKRLTCSGDGTWVSSNDDIIGICLSGKDTVWVYNWIFIPISSGVACIVVVETAILIVVFIHLKRRKTSIVSLLPLSSICPKHTQDTSEETNTSLLRYKEDEIAGSVNIATQTEFSLLENIRSGEDNKLRGVVPYSKSEGSIVCLKPENIHPTGYAHDLCRREMSKSFSYGRRKEKPVPNLPGDITKFDLLVETNGSNGHNSTITVENDGNKNGRYLDKMAIPDICRLTHKDKVSCQEEATKLPTEYKGVTDFSQQPESALPDHSDRNTLNFDSLLDNSQSVKRSEVC